jgi:hypothetical protein
MAMLNEGQAVGLIRNVKVVPNEITLPAQTTIDAGVSGSMGPIGATDVIPGL